jgi:vacuolar-type H+-ATPase subunit H
MNANPHAAPTGDTLEPIKRVKATEEEALATIAALAESVRKEVESLVREAEDAVLRARTEGEAVRERLLTQTKADAEQEARTILTAAEAKAAQIRGKSAAELASARDQILDAVLGAFRAGKKA